MAGTNDFQNWAEGAPGANLMSLSDYIASTARQNGVDVGIADETLHNRQFRQASAIAKLIGDFIAAQGFNCLDDGNDSNRLVALQSALAAYISAQQIQTLWVREEQPSGTVSASSGMAAGVWTTRVLNTTKVNTISGASLGSNQITLPAGTYTIISRIPFSNVTAGPNLFKGRLRNVTDVTDVIIGSSQATNNTAANPIMTWSDIIGQFSLAAQKTLEIDHWNSVGGSGGAPVSAGVVEVYTEAFLRKIA